VQVRQPVSRAGAASRASIMICVSPFRFVRRLNGNMTGRRDEVRVVPVGKQIGALTDVGQAYIGTSYTTLVLQGTYTGFNTIAIYDEPNRRRAKRGRSSLGESAPPS